MRRKRNDQLVILVVGRTTVKIQLKGVAGYFCLASSLGWYPGTGPFRKDRLKKGGSV